MRYMHRSFIVASFSLAFLSVPGRAVVDLRWAPALNQALTGVTGPAADIARGFDVAALMGLQTRINEIDALSRAGVNDLDALRVFRLRSDDAAAAFPADRLAALERSLTLFTRIIVRLEAKGAQVEDWVKEPATHVTALSRAMEAEGRETDERARVLADRYGSEQGLETAIADSEEVDALVHDRNPYVSIPVLDRLSRVYDSGRTRQLIAKRNAETYQLALVSADERDTMRDAVAPEIVEKSSAAPTWRRGPERRRAVKRASPRQP